MNSADRYIHFPAFDPVDQRACVPSKTIDASPLQMHKNEICPWLIVLADLSMTEGQPSGLISDCTG
jgi:hypothetical protein